MKTLETKKPVWAEGVLLGQQHFQAFDKYNESLHVKRADLTQAYNFGFQNIEIDPIALASGILNINRLTAILENGRFIEFNRSHNNELKLELPIDQNETSIYLAIASNDSVENIEGYQVTGQLSAFRSDYENVPDQHDQSRIREVMFAQPNLFLLKDSDIKTHFDVINMVSLTRGVNGYFEINKAYIPPLLNIKANAFLVELLSRTATLMTAKVNVLLSRRQSAGAMVELGPNEMNTFLLLNSLLPVAKKLEHINKMPLIHPERLYCELLDLVSKASLFEHSDLIDKLPVYDHINLFSVFQQFESLIKELLEGVVPKQSAGLKLVKNSPAIYEVSTIEPCILESSDLYIAVDFNADNTKWIETFSEQVKVGSTQHIEMIVGSALDGVQVIHNQRPPNKLVIKSGYEYFKVVPSGYFWKQVLEELSLSIFLPFSLQAANLEIVSVERY
ncbi:type VI secretion system baseplate subunit TssK [Pseudoalteromonas denitrificans]|uniref:Type VI secretion system protein ImpJ n=1 Tax=Pseudoalteromonas denitrificans DSM 6059 TaxID=1123010 RepID=A0A1I1NDY8_9GAMM|nr:type VI secretion system baseplate subunit TssK [Pseudoalteromonas denitrificans]SFC95596.1 type VI secretion system protein ImpJ [Pseudoalteromonas denitrificans DSM 6059]